MGPDLSFEEHLASLRGFLSSREGIVEKIEAVLNGQRTASQYMQGRAYLARQIEGSFGANVAFGSLEGGPWSAAFKPRAVQHLNNDLIHPAEMMIRGVHCWQQTRWPGRSARVHYANTLFNLQILRSLQFLSLRLWESDPSQATQRLAELQSVLDALWGGSPANQPKFVGDARWLIPLAQSLITDDLAPYFEVARLITDTLEPADVVEICRAHVRMLGGHLTSQIRYYCLKDGVGMEDRSVVNRTRASNALDFALLLEGLVPLLKEYQRALSRGDERARIEMAAAIGQGISPDPELFLKRFELLGAYSMIEDVLVARDTDGRVAYTAHGQRHTALVKEYRALVEQSFSALREDLPRFRPVPGGCSPYGILCGLPSTLIEHMALKAIEPDAETRYSLEDAFDDRDVHGAKLAWVNGWRRLPHVPRQVQRSFEFPQQFAEEVYQRIEKELAAGVADTGRLQIASGDGPSDLPAKYWVSSDLKASAQLLRDRQEGHFLVSFPTSEGWRAVKKELLTDILGAGHSASVSVPAEAAEVLRLMCGELVPA